MNIIVILRISNVQVKNEIFHFYFVAPSAVILSNVVNSSYDSCIFIAIAISSIIILNFLLFEE